MPILIEQNFRTKFVFVTGGVVSALGKGITAASLASLLEARNLNVTLIKLDPYINVDAGTMSPLQHGEVFVTNDGAEADLDLGHYERFVNINMTQLNNFTAGKVYKDAIKKEREGHYLGTTIQVIPHITDEIKKNILKVYKTKKDLDLVIVEIGGTVGDMESLPFLEAIRQLSQELGKQNSVFLHLTLLPHIRNSGELKTKPTQHSVKELRGIGIQPDILVCRCEEPFQKSEQEKISLFTNVEQDSVFSAEDVKNIYEIPIKYHKQGLDACVLRKLNITSKPINLGSWKKVVHLVNNRNKSITIAMVGKYISFIESYKSVNEALFHAGMHNSTKVKIKFIDSEIINPQNISHLMKGINGILVPGGFGFRGIEGKITSIRYARENNVPFLGICLGMQLSVIEYARNVLGIKHANSTEFDKNTRDPVVALIEEWRLENSKNNSKLNFPNSKSSMRLGSQPCYLRDESLVKKIYGKNVIHERHRHRYEVNNHYLENINLKNLYVSGKSGNMGLVETIELKNHTWFIGCQFHPEFTSNPRSGHPLFESFVNICLN